jgi:hypothetical protein
MVASTLSLLLLAGCVDKDGVDSVAPAGDSGRPSDAPAWLGLSSSAGWVSSDRGVATGAGLADLDGDGFDELVVAYGNDIELGPLVLYDNDGGRLLPTPVWSSESVGHHGHLTLGDVDGDGDPDVVVSRYLGDAGWGSAGGVDLYRNDGGVLTAEPVWRWQEASSFACALGDVDRDGDLDLAIAAGEAYQGSPVASVVLANPGDGRFADAVWTGPAGHALDAGWADLDGDGWLDLVLARVGAPHVVFAGDGGGGLGAEPGWLAEGDGFEGNTLDFGDVDGDGWLDLAISDNDQQGGRGTVRLYCGPELAVCWESGGPEMWSAVSLEDVDGDGRPDLVAGSWWGRVRAWTTGEAVDAPLGTAPAWESGRDDLVLEALAWSDLDRSHAVWEPVEGEGIVPIPRGARARAVQGGVAGDGYLTGPGVVRAEVLRAAPRDLVITDWTATASNLAFLREDG